MTSYDLSSVEAEAFAQSRPLDRFLTWSLSGLSAAWLIAMLLAVPRVVTGLPSLVRSPSSGWWVLALFGVTVLFGIVVVALLVSHVTEANTHAGRGPVRVDVGPQGFTLIWAEGAPVTQVWTELSNALVIKDFSDAGYRAQLRFGRNRWVALTGDAAKALSGGASQCGLSISVQNLVAPDGSRGLQTVISTVSSGGA